MNSLDWAGSYRGYLPCADCPGIDTTLTLTIDLRWNLQMRYDTGAENLYERSGNFHWEADGNHIRLNGVEDAPNRYQVGENRLVQMDMQGNRITGELAEQYVLKKVDAAATTPAAGSLFDASWRLVEMSGQVQSLPPDKLPLIRFAPETNSISGFSGCNQFSGTYELLPGNRLRFSRMASTMMACADMSLESEFHRLLGTVDNYTITGTRLSLNRARMAPLLVFEAAADR